MAQFAMRLYEDVLPEGVAPVYLPAALRAIYVVEGGLSIEHAEGTHHVASDNAWIDTRPLTYASGAKGARIWRWELTSEKTPPGLLGTAPGTRSVCKLDERVELDGRQDWLLRCDRVDFPPGGIAHTHVHQGPGIRCVLQGEISIETPHEKQTHLKGEAWLERGFEPVLAPTTQTEATTFIRCFVLPRACRGRSSIRYVRPEDAEKQKPQRYHVYTERFIDLN